ncbi:uncharacterized protein RB166_011980 [Leptodactylus fuscus]
MIASVIKSLDYESIAQEYHLKEKVKAARKHTVKLEEALEKYSDDVWKKFNEKLHEKFPTFTEEVVPILKKFDDDLEEQFKKIVREAMPIGSDLVSGLSKHFTEFFEKLEKIAAKGRDNLRNEINALRAKLHPYVEKVHEEYKAYHSHVEGELQKDYKELKERVQKSYENLKEHAKPHLENLRSKFPDGKEFQTKVEELLKELNDYIVSAE